MSRLDLGIGAALLAGALALGTWYVPQVIAAGGRPHFYQSYFGAAVMLACGHGYVNPVDADLPELREFLAVTRDDLPCDERLSTVARTDLNPLQRAYRYLMTTVSWTWSLQGRVAWSALAPLYGLFFAASIVLLYAVFRQGMGPVLAATLATVIAVSPLHIAYLAQLRDYSKMPFVLALVLLAARMVRPPMPLRRALRLAAAAGAVTGIGMGYRNDLLIAVPAFVAVLALLLPGGGFPRGWRSLAPPAAYLVAFLVALSPMWTIYRIGGGNSSQHLIVLGLSDTFSNELGLDNGGMYDLTYDYRDELAHAVISGHATRSLGATTAPRLYGPEYDRAGMNYLRQVAVNFPADMLTRVYTSALRVLELPYNARLIPPHDQYLRLPRPIFVVRDRFQRAVAPVWLPIVALTLFLLTATEVRIGVFAILLVGYLSAYPALQFGERHYFHLEFVSWWALGFVASLAGGAIAAAIRGDRQGLSRWRPAAGWVKGGGRALAVMAVLAVVVATPLLFLRQYQARHLASLFQRLAEAPVAYPAMTSQDLGDGWRRLSVPLDVEADPLFANGAVVPALVVAEFGGATCDTLKLDARFRYDASAPRFDFTRRLQIQPPLSSTPLRVFFPAYYYRSPAGGPEPPIMSGSYRLAGIDVPEAAAPCLIRLGRVIDIGWLPALFELRLPPDWRRADLYQTIAGWESRVNGDEVPTVYTAPADLDVGRQILMRPLEQLSATDIAKRSPTLDTSASTWTNRGVGGVGGKGPFLYLFEMRPRTLKAGSLALVQGNIARGGVSVGLVKDGQWLEQVGVLNTGEFTAVVRVPADGDYSLVLANNLPGSSLRNDLVIHRVGWVQTEP